MMGFDFDRGIHHVRVMAFNSSPSAAKHNDVDGMKRPFANNGNDGFLVRKF